MIHLFLFIFGAAIGSFLNVLIDRLPKEETIMGRSHCDHCKRTLQWYELIPLFSYFFSSGKSRCCGKKLSVQYPIVEFITGVIFVILGSVATPESIRGFWTSQNDLIRLIAILGIASSFIVIFFADLKYQIIPDSIQVALFVFVLLFQFSVFSFQFSKLLQIFESGLIVMVPILLLYVVTKGRGMGFGDVKLAFIIGILLGTVAGLLSLYAAFVIGAVVGTVLLLMKKKHLTSKIAFGPFMLMGVLVILIWKDPILAFFQKFYGV